MRRTTNSSHIDGNAMESHLILNTNTIMAFPSTPPTVSTPTTSMMKDDFFDNIGTPNLLLFNTSLSSSDLMQYSSPSSPNTPISFDPNSATGSLLKTDDLPSMTAGSITSQPLQPQLQLQSSLPPPISIPETTIIPMITTSTTTTPTTTTIPILPMTTPMSPPLSNNQTSNNSSTMTNIVYSTPPGSSASTPSLLSSPSTNFHYISPQPSPLQTPLSPAPSLSNSTSSLSNIPTHHTSSLLNKSGSASTPVVLTTTASAASTASFKTFSQAVNQLLPATSSSASNISVNNNISQITHHQHLNKIYPHIKLQIVSEEFKFTVFVATTLRILELKQKISAEFNGLFGTSNINNNPLSKLNLGAARLRDQFGNDLSYTKTVGDLLSDMDTVVVVQQPHPVESPTIFNSIFPTTESVSVVAKEHSAAPYNYSITTMPTNMNINNSSTINIDSNKTKKLKLDNSNLTPASTPPTMNTLPNISSPESSPAVVFSPPQHPHTPLSSNSTPIDPSSSSDSVCHKRPLSSLDNPAHQHSPNYYMGSVSPSGQHL